ncbi:unnamed protein product [Bursaphelenchus okinawaensis]|uniref:MAM domain-containing protein n=1 Tax=Bursaphelenchus okinawaensis TaxID=465554 RepID=A0A811LKJ1_9BILA|nr:unnamed protein product [Bursaphelenchus okinawaensis]CAG9127524.1 unnamed protein product [Bursaphelenchus okinawaensis]
MLLANLICTFAFLVLIDLTVSCSSALRLSSIQANQLVGVASSNSTNFEASADEPVTTVTLSSSSAALSSSSTSTSSSTSSSSSTSTPSSSSRTSTTSTTSSTTKSTSTAQATLPGANNLAQGVDAQEEYDVTEASADEEEEAATSTSTTLASTITITGTTISSTTESTSTSTLSTASTTTISDTTSITSSSELSSTLTESTLTTTSVSATTLSYSEDSETTVNAQSDQKTFSTLNCTSFGVECGWKTSDNSSIPWYQSELQIEPLVLQVATGTEVAPDGSYAIALTEEALDPKARAVLQSLAIPCQTGIGHLTVSYWSSVGVNVSFCTMIPGASEFYFCTPFMVETDPGPMYVSIPDHGGQSFNMFIIAENFTYTSSQYSGGFVIVDDISYMGQLCSAQTNQLAASAVEDDTSVNSEDVKASGSAREQEEDTTIPWFGGHSTMSSGDDKEGSSLASGDDTMASGASGSAVEDQEDTAVASLGRHSSMASGDDTTITSSGDDTTIFSFGVDTTPSASEDDTASGSASGTMDSESEGSTGNEESTNNNDENSGDTVATDNDISSGSAVTSNDIAENIDESTTILMDSASGSDATVSSNEDMASTDEDTTNIDVDTVTGTTTLDENKVTDDDTIENNVVEDVIVPSNRFMLPNDVTSTTEETALKVVEATKIPCSMQHKT